MKKKKKRKDKIRTIDLKKEKINIKSAYDLAEEEKQQKEADLKEELEVALI